MKEKVKKIIMAVFFAFIGAVLIGIYKGLGTAMYVQGTTTAIKVYISQIFGSPSTYIVMFCIFVFELLIIKFPKTGDFIYKYRYPIAGALFVLGIVFEISGSSIGEWSYYLGSEDNGIILGTSRLIRSDEWAVGTPLNIAQTISEKSGYSYFSNGLLGVMTDNYVGYRIPVLGFEMLYRPFLLGYLFLSPARAVSFYWCGKILVLLLASFEFGMLITDNKKGPSLLFMLLVAFAPVTQWWFASTLVEMLVSTEISLVLFNKYLIINNPLKRIPYVLGILICAGVFIMTLYPSWMIPFAYVILAFIIWIIASNYKKCKMKAADWCIAVGGVMLLGASVMWIMKKSAGTVSIIGETVYPGERFETGGGAITKLSEYIGNTWCALFDGVEYPNSNICERATFYGMFPLCYFLPVYNMIKNKKKDLLSVLLIALSAFFTLWCVIKMPNFIAKITFMSNSQAGRAVVVLSFVNVILFIRGVSKLSSPVKKWVAVVTALIMSIIANLFFLKGMWSLGIEQLGTKKTYCLALACVILFGIIFYLAVRFKEKKARRLLYFVMFCITFISGVVVNPIRRGLDPIDNSEWVQTIKNVSKADENAVWACDAITLPLNNICLLAGAPSINATNIYPEIERWSIIDPTGKDKDYYNRYAHIYLAITKDETRFDNAPTRDAFRLYITIDDLHKLGVTYVTSLRNLDDYGSENYEFKLIERNSNCRIYKINTLN